jgi:hypothetical protein
MTRYVSDELDERTPRSPRTDLEKVKHNARRRRARYRARQARIAAFEQARAESMQNSEACAYLYDALNALGWPAVVTMRQLHDAGLPSEPRWHPQWRAVLAIAGNGYYHFPNPFAIDGQWFIDGARAVVYLAKDA